MPFLVCPSPTSGNSLLDVFSAAWIRLSSRVCLPHWPVNSWSAENGSLSSPSPVLAQCAAEHGNPRVLGPQEAPSWLQEGRALQKTQTINQKSFKNNSSCDLRLILFKAASLHVPVPFLSLSP